MAQRFLVVPLLVRGRTLVLLTFLPLRCAGQLPLLGASLLSKGVLLLLRLPLRPKGPEWPGFAVLLMLVVLLLPQWVLMLWMAASWLRLATSLRLMVALLTQAALPPQRVRSVLLLMGTLPLLELSLLRKALTR